MITAVDVEALFQVNDTTRCPITGYEVVKSDDSTIASSDDLYSRLNIANAVTHELSISSDVPAQDGTVLTIPFAFKIKATTKGGAAGFKNI